MITPLKRALTLGLLVPSASLLPVALPQVAAGLSSGESAALHARYDPSLASLRAGAAQVPLPLSVEEQRELDVAQQQSQALAELRGGFVQSDNELTWLLIGVLIVVVLIVVL